MNYDALTTETIRHLQALIRLDTSNPPGNESLAVAYIASQLDAEGIPYTILERRPGRGNIIARLTGDGSAAPLLLMGHTDVVPAEASAWTHPPFAAEIVDNHLWGRGALDMKFMDAYELAVFLRLHRERTPLKRDVILALTADEEIAEGNGIDWLATAHPDLIRAEYAINELGATTVWYGDKPVYGIQVAEKGCVWIRLTRRGAPGHASIPRADNPVLALAEQVARLARFLPETTLTRTTEQYVNGLARVLGGGYNELITTAHNLSAPNPFPDLLPDTQRQTLHAQLHNTAVPTELHAGYKTNVIPSSASAVIDGRSLPGFDTAAWLEMFHPALDPNTELEVFIEAPPLEVPHDNALYRLMERTLTQAHSGASVLPMLMTGATDAKYLAPLGVNVYGFSPIRFERGAPGAELIHSHDERIPLDGLDFGVHALWDVVSVVVIGGA